MINSIHTVSVLILLICLCFTCTIYVNGISFDVSFDEDHLEDEVVIDLDFDSIETANQQTSKLSNPKGANKFYFGKATKIALQ